MANASLILVPLYATSCVLWEFNIWLLLFTTLSVTATIVEVLSLDTKSSEKSQLMIGCVVANILLFVVGYIIAIVVYLLVNYTSNLVQFLIVISCFYYLFLNYKLIK